MNLFYKLFYSNRKLNRLFILFIYILIGLYTFGYLIDKFSSYDELIEEIKRKNYKSVQLLTGRFLYVNWKLGHDLGNEPFKNCPEKRCYAFKTRLLQSPVEKSDGIMVHVPNLWYMPSRSSYKRNPKQLWLYYTLEPQGLTHCSSHYSVTQLDDWFNITATFKLDSDLVSDYKEFRSWDDLENHVKFRNSFKHLLMLYPDPIKSITDLSHKNQNEITQINNSKDKQKATVVWFVSHCETYSRREDYVREMMKYIDVDIYGKCSSHFPNTKLDPCSTIQDENIQESCINSLINSYKFYLSFENSLCDDYVSEKFWKLYASYRIFDVNILPIVRGAKEYQYKAVAMPNSYVNSFDFSSPKSLASYLNYLNNNKTAYLEYFNWKIDLYKRLKLKIETNQPETNSHHVSENFHLREPFCKICSLLHNETYLNSKNNRIWKISEWFDKKPSCWDEEEPRYILKK